MTHTGTDEEDVKRKDAFRDRLRGAGMVVFDPISIGDAELLNFLAEAREKGESKIAYSKGKTAVTFDIKEAEEVKDDVNDQIVARDYQLIDQSDMIVVYYFLPVMSPGVLSEMTYGFTNKKNVYAVFKGQESPFFKYYSTKIFQDEEALFEYLKEKADRGSTI
jgi:adenylate kinase